jgi:hypothetical protein
MAIPPFAHDGVLPPFLGESFAERALASPYKATTVELVERFATSPERIAILRGFLRYRADLRAFGFMAGFQWLDGSFLEEIDKVRAPRDLDLVTFAFPPTFTTPQELEEAAERFAHLFDSSETKTRYICDAYFVELDSAPEFLVSMTRYWFGLFSHRRVDMQWKGMLELPLMSLDEDEEAVKILEGKEAQ